MQEMRCDYKHTTTTTAAAIKPLNLLSAVIFYQLNHLLFPYFSVSAFEPDFVFPLENVTVAQGRDAVFTCVVNNLGGYRVSGSGTDTSTPARVRNRFSYACLPCFLIVHTVMLCQDRHS